MKTNFKKLIGVSAIIFISLIPVILLLAFGEFEASITHRLGEVFGLIGMTLFALTFVLSTRIKFIEDIFGGLDKVYIVHAIVGGTAFLFILLHPIFLVLRFIPKEMQTAASYLLPGHALSIDFGIIALSGMLILIYITLYTKIKYHKWKFTHEFLGLLFILAALHIYMIQNFAGEIFPGYNIYILAIGLIGIGAFSYSLFLKNRLKKNAIYRIKNIEKSGDLISIDLSPEHKPISYRAGQFIFLRFYNNELSKEQHPFSIASKSNNPIIRIFIKELGDFTKKIGKLKVGDLVGIEGPYGRFNFSLPRNKAQVWIAAGIGITPFLGMVQEIKDRKVDLYYSVRNENEFIGKKMFEKIADENKNFKFIPWVSEKKGHIKISDIKKHSGELRDKEFLMCGPSKFKESIMKKLVKVGVNKESLHEEIFDFR